MEDQALKKYKLFLLVPMVLLIFSIGFLSYNYVQTGEWFYRSIELKGGTQITLQLSQKTELSKLESILSDFNPSIREVRSFSGYSLLIEIGSDVNSTTVLKILENEGINTQHASIETIGPALGSAFWYQAQIGIIIAFVFMGIIVFAIFRKTIPCIAVILAAVSDIIITLALMQIFVIELSLAGFAALLMLIGYSIDTDILLTTRMLKSTGSLFEKLKTAMKTGLTMSFTTIGVLVVIILSVSSVVLIQIAQVLLIGLLIDLVNTWMQNSVLLMWHCERKGER